ncbi:hypothetical protein E5161_03815 [Cohnella pontilimi]|uniref:Uncharacterized protein n=1 Tax=Cohnella pontilimi TaxID=2564100 RepID=A0A4U0FJ62_9BACL|nr:hypothetical protein [Cohnella pontilimi]TJY44514.1 hypothetical protein E5161_03815 [Cohnella pontilimi]
MRDDDNRKRIVLIWEKSKESKEAEGEGEATVAATPLGDAGAPVLRVVSSGFGQTVRAVRTGGQPTAMLRSAA